MAQQRAPQVDGLRREDVRTPDEVAAMLRLHALGWGTRRIAAEFGCSRNTVKRYVERGGWAPLAVASRPRALDGLESWLAERFRRHRGNADVVRQELLAERDISISLRTVERAVTHLRRELAAEARATVRFETPPGRQMQVDFGEKRVVIGGETIRVYLFVATLGHSRRLHVRAFRHERQACWFEGLESAFRAFGGVTEEVLLDNTRALVVHHDSLTREVRFNARLLAFAKHWRFRPHACAPYRARTTDEVEQPFSALCMLFCNRPQATARRRAGCEVRAWPRSLKVAPPLRRLWVPASRVGSIPRSGVGRPFRPVRPGAAPRAVRG
jgi:transposase